MTAKSAFFAALLLLALFFLARNCLRLYRLVRLGRPENRFDHLPRRIGWFLWYVLAQRRVVNEAAGLNHFFIFWGFWVLLIGDIEFLIRGVFPSFSYDFLGPTVHGGFLSAQEVMAIISLIAAFVAVGLRVVAVKRFYDRLSAEALGFVIFIAAISTCILGANACQEALGNHQVSAFRPLTHALAVGLHPLQHATLSILREGFWWGLAAILFTFFFVFPWPFHLHIVGGMASVFFRAQSPVNSLAPIDFEKEETFGAAKVTDFTWKQLLDGYACTECARCQANCPAYITDKPLSPKKVILDVKANLFANGDPILKGREPQDPSPLVGGDGVQPDELWACTTCGACMEQCPVFIEHVPKIVDLRRALVMMESAFPAELTDFFKSVETNSNPYAMAATTRAKWAEGLGVPLLSEKPDAEYLYWVGCAGAFDDRNRRASRALVRCLQAAEVSFAILGPEEGCCGDSVRRLGNEYLFQEIARANVEILNGYGVNKIVTACPHGFNVLKNEYPAFGGRYQVKHHSQLLAELLAAGRLRAQPGGGQRLTFHDSCYLGRYNQIYEAPREALRRAGAHIQEMPRRGRISFCCGGGGGRMWMEETLGRRINAERTAEALKTGAKTIAVACPFCLTMLDDGVKDSGAEVAVRDIAEIVVAHLPASGGAGEQTAGAS
jgi:Fe-S oxidoreductase/uncharacterized membrane protein (DUF485 family)